MNRKTAAIIAEIIPILSAVMSFALIASEYTSEWVKTVIFITMLMAFFGFIFFFVGRKLCKGDRAVRILGIFDLLATVSVVGFYILVIFLFGL